MTDTKHGTSRALARAIAALLILVVGEATNVLAQAQPATVDVRRYAGLFELPDGAPLVVWSAAEGALTFGFGNGEVRGLAGAGDSWSYGPSIGVTEPAQGRIHFVRDGRGQAVDLNWETAGDPPRRARRVRLSEREVWFGSHGIKLSGTVIAPSQPRLGIVFLHGSGAETREPSRVFAYLLAREGVASLIFDKRATGRSYGDTFNVAFADLAGDAADAMAALKREVRQPSLPVGFFGPSQGSWVALVASSQSPPPAFLVLQSGDATSPLDQLVHQTGALFRWRWRFTDAEVEAAVAFRKQKYLYTITGEGQAEFERSLVSARQSRWLQAIGESLPNAGFWKPNGLYDPMPALRAFRGPVLALLGARDINKDVPLNARLMTEALVQAGNPASKVVVIPDANHGLFETHTGIPLERELPSLSRLAPGYLEELTSWIRQRAAGRDARWDR